MSNYVAPSRPSMAGKYKQFMRRFFYQNLIMHNMIFQLGRKSIQNAAIPGLKVHVT